MECVKGKGLVRKNDLLLYNCQSNNLNAHFSFKFSFLKVNPLRLLMSKSDPF